MGTADQWEAATMGYNNIGPNYWKGEEGRKALLAGEQKLTDEGWVAPFRQLAKWGDYLGDGFEAQTYPDSQNLFTLGRGDKNNVRVEDESASRRHAEILRDNGRLVLRDLGSTNGTAVIDPATGVWTFTPADPNWFGSPAPPQVVYGSGDEETSRPLYR